MPGSITTKPKGGLDLRGMPTAAIIGADFEQDEQRTREQAVEQRLHQPPAEEARQEVGWAPGSPALARWTLRTVRASVQAVADYSLSGLWRLLQRAGVRLRRVADQLYSPDPEYTHKVARLEHCLREAARQPEEVVVVFLDEMGYTRWPEPAPDWMLAAPHPPRQVHKAGPTNRQQRIIGALNALSGQVDYLDNYRVGREQVSAFYRQLDQVYAGVRRVYVVQDNWSIHHHGDVQVTVRGHGASVAALGPRLAAHLCALAQPDREALALAAPRRAQGSSSGRRLAAPAAAGQCLLGSVRPWLICLAALCRLDR